MYYDTKSFCESAPTFFRCAQLQKAARTLATALEAPLGDEGTAPGQADQDGGSPKKRRLSQSSPMAVDLSADTNTQHAEEAEDSDSGY